MRLTPRSLLRYGIPGHQPQDRRLRLLCGTQRKPGEERKNSLITRNSKSNPPDIVSSQYEYFVDVLKDYYSIIATPWAADDKNACGQCVEVTYTNAAGEKRKVYGVTVDSTGGYFNLDQAGFAGLDGRAAFDAGTLQTTTKTVDLQKCRRARQ